MRTRLLLCAALTLMMGHMAFADIPQLNLQVGANPVDNFAGSGNSVTYSNANYHGWNISIVLGVSNSPTLVPYGLDVTSLTATCSSGTCGQLTLQVSDTGFTQASPSFRDRKSVV